MYLVRNITPFVRNHLFATVAFLTLIMVSATFTMGRPYLQQWAQETSRQAGFVLTNLSITGIERTTRQEVLALLDVDTGMPLMAVDLNGVQTRIEALPWVRRATVTRVMPGDLVIEIEERTPYALWQRDGKVRLIDKEGVVITRYGLAAFSELPLIVGVGAPKNIVSLEQTLSQEPGLASRVKTAVRVGERRWDLLFDNGIRIKLPDNSDATNTGELAWQRFARLEKKHRLLAREVSVIDLRIKDRLIMRVTPAGRRMMDGKEWAT